MSEPAETLSEQDVREAWPVLSVADRVEALRLLPRHVAEDLLFELPSREQAELILAIPDAERRSGMRLPPPDAAAALPRAARDDTREKLLSPLDDPPRKTVRGLLASQEDEAGGLMAPRFARLRPDMTA